MANSQETSPIYIQTPIDELTHPDSQSVIDVVSTVHVGSPMYFYSLRNYLEQRAAEGFVIGAEAIRESSPDSVSEASIRDRLKYRLYMTGVRYSIRGIVRVEDSDSFTHQYELDEMLADDPLIPERVNTDVTELDVARNTRYVDLVRGIYSANSLYRKLEHAFKKGPADYDQAIYNEISRQFDARKTELQDRPKRSDRAMVHDRNQAVLEHIDKLLSKDAAAKIALVWGYGHRRGLVDGIEQRGYKLTRVASLTVAFRPHPHP